MLTSKQQNPVAFVIDSTILKIAMRLLRMIPRLAPLVSLASGVLTVALWRRGVGFAPVSATIAAVAWISAVWFSPLLAPPPNADNPVSRRWKTVRFASRTLVTSLYQNVLFFVVPIWFASATLLSYNIGFPLLLAFLALISCFDAFFAERVLALRVRRNAVSAVVLFAVSVPALCVLTHFPIRLSIALCAFMSAFFALILANPRDRRGRAIFFAALTGAGFALLLYFAAPMLPPTPVQCMRAVAAARIEQKDPKNATDRFETGIPKVFAHFSVAAPDRFFQNISFQWYVNGEKHGKPIPSRIVGGRKQGFRTWTFLSSPKGGHYRVDLLTADKQLIGRVAFRVQ